MPKPPNTILTHGPLPIAQTVQKGGGHRPRGVGRTVKKRSVLEYDLVRQGHLLQPCEVRWCFGPAVLRSRYSPASPPIFQARGAPRGAAQCRYQAAGPGAEWRNIRVTADLGSTQRIRHVNRQAGCQGYRCGNTASRGARTCRDIGKPVAFTTRSGPAGLVRLVGEFLQASLRI